MLRLSIMLPPGGMQGGLFLRTMGIEEKEIGVRSCNHTFYMIGYFHGETFTN
jgi:hypothetical protein